MIVKPNFEGSSKGITQASVVVERHALRATIDDLLERYPQGVLIEEFVDGMDVSREQEKLAGSVGEEGRRRSRQDTTYAKLK